ncbi:MAG: ABC transporter permease, partial [Flammeovirgaceae bacterium]
MKNIPPKLPLRFFRWYCHPKLVNHIEGDLLEEYGNRLKEKGKWRADLKFCVDVLLLFRRRIIRPMEGYQNLNSLGMFKNYIIIASRVMARNKVQTAINTLGLMLGMVSVFLIMLYVRYETSYDTFYPEPQNLYRITWETDNPQTRTPHPMAQAMVHDFPEVQSAVSLSPLWGPGLTRETFSFRNPLNNVQFDEANLLAVDTTFFDVFGFPVLRGDGRKALKNTNAILLSESAAYKYFGSDDPIGKQLVVFPDSAVLQVEAVFKDVPAQSHFHFDFLISYIREKSFDPEDEYYSWADFGHYNYVRLQPGTDIKALESKLLPWLGKYIPNSDEKIRAAQANGITFRLQPVNDIHLKSHLRWELKPNGNIEYVYIMSAAALLTLLIACINFMNLMTAKSTERAKEIGIRKTMGALRQQLSAQFLSESVLMAFMAVALAVLVVQVLLPLFQDFTGQVVQLNYQDVLVGSGLIGLLVGLGSGIYPAWIISSIQPQSILKGKFKASGRGVKLRNSLIVFQFIISMILISGAVTIYDQLNFIQQKNLGFSKEAVLVVPIRNDELREKMETLKAELLHVNGVSLVSASSNMP